MNFMPRGLTRASSFHFFLSLRSLHYCVPNSMTSVFPSDHTCSHLCVWGSQVCSVPARSHSRQLVSPRSPFRGPAEHPTCLLHSYLTKPRFCVVLGCPSSSVRKSAWGFLHVRWTQLLNQTPSIFLSVFTTSLQDLVDWFSNACISFCWKYKPWDREVKCLPIMDKILGSIPSPRWLTIVLIIFGAHKDFLCPGSGRFTHMSDM